MQSNFRICEGLVFFDLWILDFRSPFPVFSCGFQFRIPDSGFRVLALKSLVYEREISGVHRLLEGYVVLWFNVNHRPSMFCLDELVCKRLTCRGVLRIVFELFQ